jgi:DNA/RNA endonuclease G (NUC1)
VQYASATGTSWQVTALSGSIDAGKYYLVQEAKGSGGTEPLPTPDATGSIGMSGTSGKVALVNSNTALSGTQCPSRDASIVDFVGFGSTANCFEGTGPTATLSNTAAAQRTGNADTDDNAADFAKVAPDPHAGHPTLGGFDHVDISGATSASADAATLTATLEDSHNQALTDPNATFAWATSDANIVEIVSSTANTAIIKGHKIGAQATITVSGTSNGTTKTGTLALIVTPPIVGHVTIGSGTSPLVIGYQTQMFVNGGSTDQGGIPVTSSEVTWTSSDPSILAIDNRGVVTAVANGSAMLIGTAPDGSAGWFILSTEVPLYHNDERAGHNTELGTPKDGDASNDVIIERDQYTISYNPQHGGPNWVSWDLSKSHLGTRDRCNCYSADTALARLGFGQYMYNTADYTGGGYDRGHMEPSADQTVTDGENARTFFLTNFLPQQHNLNAGPWENLENDLRDSVKAGREAYVIAGGVFTKGVGLGSLKGEGKIFIPDSTWKIVVLMPANDGLSNVTSASDIDVIAVNMPNVADGLVQDWTAYRTSVQSIQRSTGYDFLSELPQAIQDQVENHVPVVGNFPGATILAGETYTAAGTFTDLDRDPWTASANYGDHTASQNVAVSGMSFTLNHVYVTAGAFTATVTVSDGRANASGSAVVTVQSPAPGIANLDDALATLTDASLGGGLFAGATASGTSTTQSLTSGELESLRAKLTSATSQLVTGRTMPAANMVGAFANELQAMVRSGRVAGATGAPIIAYALRVVASIRKF